LPPAFKGLDNNHATAATRAWWAQVRRFLLTEIFRLGRNVEQIASKGQVGLSVCASKHAVVPDAVM